MLLRYPHCFGIRADRIYGIRTACGAHQRIEKYRKIDGVIVVTAMESPFPVHKSELSKRGMASCSGATRSRCWDTEILLWPLFIRSNLPTYLITPPLGFTGARMNEQGKTDEVRVRAQAEWCQERGIPGKGAPAGVARGVSSLGPRRSGFRSR